MPIYRESSAKTKAFSVKERKRQTISQSVSIKGVGLFSAAPVTMTFCPNTDKNGIFFKRLDLPGQPLLKASIEHLKATPRCTILGNDEITIQCVEHILSALYASKIDDMIIELDSHEPPIFDGSSKVFIEMIEEAGIKAIDAPIEEFHLDTPQYLQDGNVQIVALPSKSLKISYTLSYPNHPLLSSQFHVFDTESHCYKDEIAPCRTFALLDEVKVLIEKEIIKSASLDHGVIVDGEKIVNPEGLRFDNEMARHKILDMIGDLSLVGKPVIAHFIAICSGHTQNTAFAKHLHTLFKES